MPIDECSDGREIRRQRRHVAVLRLSNRGARIVEVSLENIIILHAQSRGALNEIGSLNIQKVQDRSERILSFRD
jgi:hypothetical protein